MLRTSCFARLAVSVGAVSLLAVTQAGAWASTGHRIIGQLGVATLPAELPAFLRDPVVVQQVGEISREPDRSRGAGQPHDEDLDPGHFIDLTDDGHTLNGPLITEMPRDRDAFSAVLRANGSDLHKTGWLYYNLIDGYEQLVKDFAYWRIDVIGEKRATDPTQKAWYGADRKERELLIVRDLGYWSHFVGDTSQPMHVSVHYNGWGQYPNPSGYTNEHIHGPFEGTYVFKNVTAPMVQAAMAAPTPCQGAVPKCLTDYMLASQAKVEPLFALWKDGGFQPGDQRGVRFATERVAAGAAMLRDLVTRAWRDSADQSVGYPGVKVSAIELGAELPFSLLYGDD